jgi:hypothetical protein
MVEIKRYTGGLNQDTALELIPQGDYIDALNVQVGAEGVEKLLGNTEVQSNVGTPSGTNWVCGSHFDKNRQKVIYFWFNSDQYHTIVSVDVNTLASTVLFQDITNTGGSSILNWGTDSNYNPNKIIKDIKIIYRDNGGDLVYFIDPLKRPLKFNTETLPTLASTNDVLFDYFKVIKAPPNKSISALYIDVPNRNINNLRKKLFQFKYRFLYDDEEKSVWSAVSNLPLISRANDASYYADGTKSNGIQLSLNSGSKIVKKIEIAGRVNIESEWSDFFLVDTLNKQLENISNDVIYNYLFLNDGSYIPIDIEEGNLLYDYVPDEANALELANGNTLVYGGIKEGLPRTSVSQATILTNEIISYGDLTYGVAVGGLITGNTSGNPAYYYNQGILDFKTTNYRLEIIFDGNISPGDIVTLTFNLADTSTVPYTTIPASVSYTVQAGDTLVTLRQSLANLINASYSLYMLASTVGTFGSSTLIIDTIGGDIAFVQDTWYGISIVPIPSLPGFNIYSPNGSGVNIAYTKSGNNSLGVQVSSALKWKGRYKYGICYYNKDGKTNGVYTGKNLIFDVPEYKEVSGVAVTFSPTLDLNFLAPSWAEYYTIVRTKELTSTFSKFFLTRSVDRSQAVDGPPKTGEIRINIQNIADHATRNPSSSTIINYGETSFVKGDRIRFIKNQLNNTVFTNQKDYEIIGVRNISNSLQIIISYVDGMPDFSNSNFRFLIEIFRPAPIIVEEEENVFYEISRTYTIQRGFRFIFSFFPDPNGNPYHEFIISAGFFSNYHDLSYDGDYYLKERRLVVFANNNDADYIKYICMDSNFDDNWESAVWNRGRPLVIDESAKTQYFPAMLRFSQSYIYGTNINNLNRFYPENFEEADASFGDILRLKTRENFIRMFQRFKTAMIPIYRSIIVDNATSTQVSLSEKLLNKPNYYAGEYGIDKYGSSLVSTDYGDYFLDTINRAIVRVSLDGVTNISDTNNMSAYSNTNLEEDSYGYGYFNYENRNVIMLSGKVGSQNSIIAYNENRKVFISKHGYVTSTSFLFVNGFAWSFLVKPYIHDNSNRCNFFGAQQMASISTVFNGNVNVKKTYLAIEIMATQFVASNMWTGTLSTGPSTNQTTSISEQDFIKSYASGGIATKEFKGNATIKRNESGVGGKYFGEAMKGLYSILTLANGTQSNTKLISVSLKYIQSPLTNS